MGFAYFALKSFASISSLMYLHKEQIFMCAKLIDMSLNRLKFAPIVSLLMLAFRSYWSNLQVYFFLDISVASILFYFCA